jgi:ABC-2 type transport system permease protein
MFALQSAKLTALVHLPACLIWASVLARVSCSAGKASMVYLAAAFGWLAYVGLATLTATPLIAGSFVVWEPLRSAMLLADPYAITALVNPPPLDGLSYSREIAIVIDRIIWLGACYLLLRGIAGIPAFGSSRESAAGTPTSGLGRWHKHWDRADYLALLLRWIMFEKFFLLALVGWVVLAFPEVYGGMQYAEPLAVLIPDSRDALNRVTWNLVVPVGTLLLLYAADRAARMGCITGMESLTAATPYPSWRFVGTQLALLWLVALALLAVTLLVVCSAQLAASSPVQSHEYLAQGVQILPGLLLSATAFVAIHSAVRSRMTANLIGVILLVLGHSSLAPAMGLNHPLWRPLAIPLTTPDHVLGLDANWAALSHFALFWTAICGAAIVVAIRVHHRGLPYRQVLLRQALLHPAVLAVVLLLVGGSWQGLAIHRIFVADSALLDADEAAKRRADYERRYAKWQNRPQPIITGVRSFVDFSDNGLSADLRVTMELTNAANEPIERILVGRNQIDAPGKVAIDGGMAEVTDGATGQTVFRLSSPMRPGETRQLRFATRIARSALASTESLLILRAQFASLPAFQILPVIGYQREFSLRDLQRRAKFGLPPLAITPPSRLAEPRAGLTPYQARFESIVSVPDGHYGLAPGELVRSWSKRGRSTFIFRTDRAIRSAPMFFALPWTPQRWQLGSLSADIYAPRPIAANDPNLLGMGDTLAWLDRAVAPYPGQSLRLIAAPEFGSSGFAVPQAVLISHRLGFRASPAPDAGFDQAYRRAVHETAHQWFGHLIGYGIPEERAFLVESLAKYAELVMVERRYGTRAMRALVAWEADRFARARLAPAEAATPLIDTEDSEDMYSRATMAFACLRTRVGDTAIAEALREVAAASLQSDRPARSLDFVRAVRRAGGKQNESVIDQLLLGNLPIEAALTRSRCDIDG